MKLLSTSILALFIVLSQANASEHLPLNSVSGEDLVNTRVLYDFSGKESIETVPGNSQSWKKGNSRVRFPVKGCKIWQGFRLHNDSPEPQRRLIYVDEAYILHADLYQEIQGSWIKTPNGLAVPISNRTFNSRLPVFNITLKPGETRTFFLMLNSKYTLVTAGFTVATEAHYIKKQRAFIMFFAFYLGAVLSIVLYNAFLFFSLQEKGYIYYVLHGLMYFLFVFSYSGILVMLDVSPLTFERFGMFITAGIGFFLMFTRELLQVSLLSKILDRILKITTLFFFLLALLVFIDIFFYNVMIAMAIPVMLLQIGTGIYALVKKVPVAKYYLLGASWYFIGNIIITLVNQELIPFNYITRYSFIAGSLLEMVTFSFALAFKVKLLESEKKAARQQLLENEKSERNRLQVMVKERTAELERLLSVVSHDFRAPLGSLVRFMDSILSSIVSGSTSRTEELTRQSRELAGYIYEQMDNTLYWIKARSHNLTPDMKKIDLDLLLGDTINFFKDRIIKKELTLKWDRETGSLPEISSDWTVLAIIMRNIFSNAVKYTPVKGSISITTSINSDYLYIHIENTGEAIKAETLDLVENRGELVSTPGTINEKGTGIGLKLALSLAKSIACRVDIIPGKNNTTATVGIPMGTNATMKNQEEEVPHVQNHNTGR